MRRFLLWLIVGLAAVLLAFLVLKLPSRREDDFTRLMTRGNGFLESGDATNAIATFSQVVNLAPENIDARLNLANAFLLAGDFPKVIEQCQQAIALDHNSAAAYYLDRKSTRLNSSHLGISYA